MKLRLCFLLYEHSPWGGRERNCAASALACARAGHAVTVLTRRWHGERPSELRIVELGTYGRRNIVRDESFVRLARAALDAQPFDVVVAFDLVPHADVFYAADPCLALEARQKALPLRWTRRMRRRLAWEHALCEPAGCTRILVLTERQQDELRQAYGTPAERIHVLPPNLDDAPVATRAQGAAALAPLGVSDEHVVLLFVGSDFGRKGLDRAIDALAGLPAHVRLVAVGDDDPASFARRARRRGVEARVRFAGPRADVSAFHARADVLVHPARKETAGIVLLEALRNGVPVLTTEACGFAEHVTRSGAGVVLAAPLRPAALHESLRLLVGSARERRRLGELGRAYARRTELSGRHERIRALIEECARASPRA